MPEHDLEQLWEAHTRYEFETRDVDATMATMVEQPYVNHIPTMTGGVGHLVDEFVVHFTHTTEIDWMLPGIAPTGRKVSAPTVAVVQFQDGKLVHEHIYWDQASVLAQIGLLDPSRLPITGAEAAQKVADKTLPSNALMKRWQESAGKPI